MADWTRHGGIFFLAAYLLLGSTATEAREPNVWSVSPFVGVHAPDLKDMNEGIFKAPSLVGTASTFNASNSNTSNQYAAYNVPTTLDAVAMGSHAGVEFTWHLDEKSGFLIGGSTFEATSQNNYSGDMTIQGGRSSFHHERLGKISYNDFFLGWRYNWLRKPKTKSYVRFSLHELFDIDYQDKQVYRFYDGRILARQSNSARVTEVVKVLMYTAQATGGLMFQLGMGGEHFFTKWFSIGFEANIAVGFRKFTLRDLRENSTFLSTDNLRASCTTPIPSTDPEFNPSNPQASRLCPGYPAYQPPLNYDAVDGAVTYNTGDGTYKKALLGFDGWKALLTFNIYY